MNVLIITTFFPPDSAIAAVRPYMFAKYLMQFGHQVTVLRSGVLWQNPDNSFPPLENLQVISYLGENSPAEVFTREGKASLPDPGKSRISFLPDKIRKPIARAYHMCFQPLDLHRSINYAKELFQKQRESLEELKQNQSFDVVFATYGELENVYAGEYASALFGCPWILDMRDPIAQPLVYRGLSLLYLKRFQDAAVSKADACTLVSNDMRKSSPGMEKSRNVTVLYNGYEPFGDDGGGEPAPGSFSLCYTGMLYKGRRDVTPLLQALKQLSSEGKIDLSRVQIEYAGPDFQYMREDAEALGIETCLADHGYVTRAEASRMQKRADVFLLLSWNTKREQGVLTGKFYEGIRCSRPILALVDGDTPNSELYQLNQKYHYGFCYEEARRQKQFPELCAFLLQLYTQKMEHGSVEYAPSEEFSAAFRYDTLTRQLETLCKNLVESNG